MRLDLLSAQKGGAMKSSRVSIATAVTLVVVLGGLSAPASGQLAGNAVTEWNLIAVSTIIGLPGRGGGGGHRLPPRSSRG
jgi:hypothetical protein